MMRRLATIILLACLVSNAASGDMSTVGAPTGYFVPTDAQKLDPVYFRGPSGDWEWQHDAIATGITSAKLSISAFDVDTVAGEIDNIYAMDNTVWTLIGTLEGSTQAWTITTFDLDSPLFDDIESGLKVRIDIAAGGGPSFWVSLGKSVITTNGTPLPNMDLPADPVFPLPGAVLLGSIGLGLSGWICAKKGCCSD